MSTAFRGQRAWPACRRLADASHPDGCTSLDVQLIGPMHEDGFVLEVAERLERELGMIWMGLAERNFP